MSRPFPHPELNVGKRLQGNPMERVVRVTGRAKIDGLLGAEEAVRLQLVAGARFEFVEANADLRVFRHLLTTCPSKGEPPQRVCSSNCSIISPSAFAVFMLTISLNRVG